MDGGAGPVGGPAEWRTGRDNQPDILGELFHGQARKRPVDAAG